MTEPNLPRRPAPPPWSYAYRRGYDTGTADARAMAHAQLAATIAVLLRQPWVPHMGFDSVWEGYLDGATDVALERVRSA